MQPKKKGEGREKKRACRSPLGDWNTPSSADAAWFLSPPRFAFLLFVYRKVKLASNEVCLVASSAVHPFPVYVCMIALGILL
jgi:hypothetical protein